MTSLFDRRAIPADLHITEWRAADGWPLRRFDWHPATGETRGSILFQAGRGDFIEKYLEVYGHWHAQGWQVSGFDWRGQGGSGRLLADRAVGHLPSLDPLLRDFDELVALWLAESPAPHVLIGHSMGGHLALRLLAEHQIALDAAVLVAPMLGLNTGPIPAAVARGLARTLCALGLTGRPAWREGNRPGEAARTRQTNLTACLDRYADEMWWKKEHPELALATPSWGWLLAAFESIAKLDRPGVMERVVTPMLVLGSEHDRLVSPSAIRRAAARLPNARLLMSKEGAHELLREVDSVRLPLLAAIDHFLDEKAPRR
jgi:lysophospholipase